MLYEVITVVNEDLEEIVKSGLLSATMDFAQVASADCVAICVQYL